MKYLSADGKINFILGGRKSIRSRRSDELKEDEARTHALSDKSCKYLCQLSSVRIIPSLNTYLERLHHSVGRPFRLPNGNSC
jgi:hypothetical protein